MNHETRLMIERCDDTRLSMSRPDIPTLSILEQILIIRIGRIGSSGRRHGDHQNRQILKRIFMELVCQNINVSKIEIQDI
jgi:hypothetical protein